MGIFSYRNLDYSNGDGSLARIKTNRYLPHRRPGEFIVGSIDIDLLSEETKNGKHSQLLKKAVEFAQFLDYLEGDYDYRVDKSITKLAVNPSDSVGGDLDSMLDFLANTVKKSIDNSADIYWELLPYLKEFESRLNLQLDAEQRKTLMCFFRVGRGLSLIENLSGRNIQGFCHPSIFNILCMPRQVWLEMQSYGYSNNLSFLGENDAQMRWIGLALYSGYFQSKYTAEPPLSVFKKLTK
jgi:hypothetical protein